MNCESVQDLILDSLDAPLATPERHALEEHLTACADCRGFLETQAVLDRALAVHYAPPELSQGFQQALQRRLRAEKRRALWEAVPDLLHLAGGAALTAACACVLPFSPGTVLAAGGAATAASYLVLSAARSWLENAQERA